MRTWLHVKKGHKTLCDCLRDIRERDRSVERVNDIDSLWTWVTLRLVVCLSPHGVFIFTSDDDQRCANETSTKYIAACSCSLSRGEWGGRFVFSYYYQC